MPIFNCALEWYGDVCGDACGDAYGEDWAWTVRSFAVFVVVRPYCGSDMFHYYCYQLLLSGDITINVIIFFHHWMILVLDAYDIVHFSLYVESFFDHVVVLHPCDY